MSQPPPPELPRCEARRRQILEAAAICFAREGFHGASIAQLSKAAGMSPGHIYHFFDSKEAIIAALVARNLERSLAVVQHFTDTDDLLQALLDRVDLGLNEKTDPDNAALELEILAEAARNPQIAALVREADRVKRERLEGLFRRVRHGRCDDEEAVGAVTEVVMALFQGLAARAINHPELDRAALVPWLRVALRALL